MENITEKLAFDARLLSAALLPFGLLIGLVSALVL